MCFNYDECSYTCYSPTYGTTKEMFLRGTQCSSDGKVGSFSLSRGFVTSTEKVRMLVPSVSASSSSRSTEEVNLSSAGIDVLNDDSENPKNVQREGSCSWT